MRRTYCAVFIIQSIFINFCLCELTAEKKQKFLNGFIDSLNNLPDQPYIYEDGVLLDVQKIDSENGYQISVRLKASDIHNLDAIKFVKCTASVVDLEENGVTRSWHQCTDDPEGGGVQESQDGVTSSTSTTSEDPTESTGPVRLYNEVQSDTEITSGEQFVAIPRTHSNTPCIGCASHVDPEAVGVREMAQLGIRHLNLHDPLFEHTLHTVVDVERQVQVVNGVRYILTLLVNYNNCTTPGTETCPTTIPCKISILEKPWKKLRGSKYRAIIANNCTLEWQFGDEGEVLPNENNENNELYPDPSNNSDEDLKVIHNFDVQVQPNQEKPITEEMIKNIEAQIIPRSEFGTTESNLIVTDTTMSHDNDEHKDETVINYYENTAPFKQSHEDEPNTLSEDKKQAIDDIINFFNFAGLRKPDAIDEHQRNKRSYENDLKMLALAKKFKKVKKNIDNANYIHNMAQIMVDYLNELDLVVKNRILKDVLVAEDEVENNQHFFYLQVSTTTPCDKMQCTSNDFNFQICNGVVDNTNEKFPKVLNAFCYDQDKNPVKKVEQVTFDDPVLVKLGKKAFQKIESESTKKNAMKILRILDATTRKASGTLTRLSMSLAYTNCDKSLDFYKRADCTIIEDMGTIICEVAIYEKKKSKNMKIAYHCSERGVHESFSDTVNHKSGKDNITDPEILNMVNEALQNLEIQSNKNNKQKIVEIKSVSTKVVAGLLTRILFSVGYTDCSNDKIVDLNTCNLLTHETLRHCEVQVWDRPWLEDSRQLKVKCDGKPFYSPKSDTSGSRKKRSLYFVGGEAEQDIDNPKFKQYAEESAQKYLQSTGSLISIEKIKLRKVTSQVVSGIKYKIDFDIHPTNGDVFSCHSEVLDRAWLNNKEINVNCKLQMDNQTRAKRQIRGGESEQEPSDPKYKTLAEESLEKYIQSSGTTLKEKVIKVVKVTTQVVSGSKTRIDFEVHPSNGDMFTCHSEILEQPWLNQKGIDVTCDLNDTQTREKRQLFGGESEQEPSDPKYKTLAEESLEKYIQSSGTTLKEKVIKVVKVTTQVVSGSKTRIDFEVHPSNGDMFTCHSEILEQPWLNKKEIDVTCDLNDKQTREKRQLFGGESEQEPSDPKYKTLAEESLEKYIQSSGTTLKEKVIKVVKVTTQVVSGSKTRIDFEVHPSNGDMFTCHSEILEQPWLNQKGIDVTCDLNDTQTREKRQLFGGESEQEPSDPKYKTLAEESLEKYIQSSGTTLKEKVIKVVKVTTQVVSGSKTRIDFEVHPSNGDMFTCHSEILEQPWLNQKGIDVTCDLNDTQTREKRQLFGGESEQEPSDPEYKTLAEESLEKYIQSSGTTLKEKVIKVVKVTTQVVSGSITRIDFEVHPSNGDMFTCHSEILEQIWLNKKEIDVTCNLNDKQTRERRQIAGGELEQEPSDPKYKTMGEESLEKYLLSSGTTLKEKVIKVVKVTTQVVSGSKTRIDFEVHPSNGDMFTCHSEILEQPWLNKKEIDVTCDLNDKQTREKRQLFGGESEQEPSDPKYKTLAEESLEKYIQSSGTTLKEKVIKVVKVTTQVVSGSKTRIDFEVHPSNGDMFTCHSEILEQPWLNQKGIDVTCDLNDTQTREKRQLFGGESEQEPSDPKYKTLAEESLEKYIQSSGTTLKEKVIKVVKVTTQVVSGSKTRIDFEVHPSNGDMFTCHSEILEQPWLNQKGIDVTCDLNDTQTREKRQLFGGESEQEPSDPEYKTLAEESLEKYIQSSGTTLKEKVIKVVKVTTQVVSGSITRIDFEVHPSNGDMFTCHSEILEQIWLNKKEIDVTCNLNDKQTRERRQIAGGELEQEPSDPKYKTMGEESLEKYLQSSGTTLKEKVIKVVKVTTQVVSGSKTRIDFEVHPSNGDMFTCHSEILEQPWLNKKEIDVTCDLNDKQTREKRQLFGGESEQEPSDPKYKTLAEESLEKYIQSSGTTLKEKVIKVVKVTTQVVSGSKTRIDFEVHPSNGDMFTCHSEILEQPWLNQKGIDVTCDLNDTQTREKRQLFGGESEQEPSDPEYKTLAEESLEKYIQSSGTTLKEKVIKVVKVTTQVVSGSITRIDFEVHPSNGDMFTCHSEILEQIWLNKKEIDVTCNLNDKQTRERRQIAGGELEQEPSDPKYKTMGEESLEKYLQSSGTTLKEKVIKVVKVTTQVVSGSITRIDFEVHPSNGDMFTCHSEILEQAWLNKKEIDVTCNLNDKLTREKRQILGGESEQEPSDPEYKTLAEESLEKYIQSSGTMLKEKVIKVVKVTTQVVSGSKTRIDFEVHPLNGDMFTCHSEIWEQTWLNKKEIDVTCDLNDKQTREKRQIPGGESEQEPSDPEYKTLAEESLEKYIHSSGTTLKEKVIKVVKVTTQVVSGSITRIDFEVHPSNGDMFTCHSEILEQIWLNKKEIDVTCNVNDKQTRERRQIAGGELEQEPSDPKYKTMGEESLEKYLQSSGTTLKEKVIKVVKVTTQVVSGSITRIDFEVHPSNGDMFTCHSEILEQAWLNKKEIDVTCNLNDKLTREKRQILGGESEQEPSDPEYKTLAEESLEKYIQSSGTTLKEKVIKVVKVTTQVVSGSKTRIDFEVHPLNGDMFTCHSEIWEQTWLNKKEIDVTCDLNDKQTREKRQIPGGESEQEPSDPEYKTLAEESLEKYIQSSGTTLKEKVIKVVKVTTQVVSGSITRIDFEVHPSNGDMFTCHSEILEQIWLNKKEIDVTCNVNEKHTRAKRHYVGGNRAQDSSDPKYKTLAEESLQKYLQTSDTNLNKKVIKVTKVTTQVVSGSITRIDFEVHPSNDDVFTCHSEIWEQPWLNKKDISVDCNMSQSKSRSRSIRKQKVGHMKRNQKGAPNVTDPNKPEYKTMASESLKKYMKLQNEKVHHEVLEVKHVIAQVVAGTIYEIDFTAAPTTCSVDDADLSKCKVKNETILYCHTRVWSRPWLKLDKIEASCNSDINEGQTDDGNDEDFERKKRNAALLQNNPADNVIVEEMQSKINKTLGIREGDGNKEEYRDLTKEVVLKFERLSNAKYMHKITKIHRVLEEVNEGIMTSIEFSISPTICLIGDDVKVDSCKLKQPEINLSCMSTVWERTWIFLKDIKVSCKNSNVKYVKPLDWDDEIPGAVDENSGSGREKRQSQGDEEEYIDDDLKFYYADRAIKHLNDKSHTHNLQKLVTIHAIDDTVQMGVRMVRMYIETAVTYCLRRQALPDLPQCDEIEGMSHKLCHIRLWPFADDELIVQHVAAICDDEKDFFSITGLDIPLLIAASIREVEKSPNVEFKLIHQGEPYIIPSLNSKHPIKINFVVVSTNCSKDVDVYRNRDICFVDTAKSATTCQSAIALAPDSMVIKYIKAKCNAFNRNKRSVTFNPDKNTTDDMTIAKLVEESLQKLEGQSLNNYKQRVMQINSYTTKIKRGRVTTIDFDVGYTSCLKYEYVSNISTCEFIDHLPRRHCVSDILERLWVDNGRNIEVICEDDETRLEQHIEYESAEKAMELANEALKHIEAKYPHPNKLKVTRIFSLEKQALAGIHYRMKIEVGFTDCLALSIKSDCKLKTDEISRFCRVNVWIRPWTDHAPNFRVTCDYQEGLQAELYHTVQSEHLFYDFVTTYRPDYMEDDQEMMKRFKIFSDNVRKVHELNVHERGTARYGITRFADLTYEEFSSKYLGLKPGLRSENDIPMIEADIPKLRLPEKFDWRDHGAVTAVKDQGSCGSCWAFSVTGNIEGQWKLQTGKLVSLSEQELVDCDKLDQGCNGGLMDNAYRAVEELGGLETESDYPYEGEDDKCVFNKTMSKVQISGAVNISSNETDMAKWLLGNGPISIGINANAMQFYVAGISHPWKMLCSPKNLDHGVLIVGFGAKDYPLFHKHLPYWIVKNSWGPSWGEQGYYRVYRGDGTCGVNQMASSAVV